MSGKSKGGAPPDIMDPEFAEDSKAFEIAASGLEAGETPTLKTIKSIARMYARRPQVRARVAPALLRWRATPQLKAAEAKLGAEATPKSEAYRAAWCKLCVEMWGEFMDCPGAYDD